MDRDKVFDWIAYTQRLEATMRELALVAQQAKSYIDALVAGGDALIAGGEGCNHARQIVQQLGEALAKVEKGQ